MDESSVRVALRIRPQVPSEVIDMCRVCTQVTPGEPQIWLGSDKAFTYDHVFDTGTLQESVYEACVKDLIRGTLDGYNATILAYGQTGSGKTYSMGTGFDMDLTSASGDLAPEQGIIPRAVHHLFASMDEIRQETVDAGQPPPEFKMNAQFMELYNEEIYDLFDPARNDKRSSIRIHEDALGGIYVTGVATRLVTSMQETLQCLKAGALSRTTASTQMNAQSSRSHAIFTLHIKQQRLVPSEEEGGAPEFETLTAKLHFVDLAGSERLKRTGATGDRAKEGISINCGLLALGNVISALGDKSRRVTHVPYRDSKLTRLLQDSLGGNSRTLMIACVSPSDRDFMETLNTLKYANRARNIQNRITVNQDKNSKTLALLRQEIAQLQLELAEYKQGKRVINGDGEESINDMFHENKLLQTENGNLRTRIKALQETVDSLTARNSQLLAERAQGDWMTAGEDSDVTKLIQGYLQEIEELRAKLCESENIAVQLRKALAQRSPVKAVSSPSHVAIAGHYDVGAEDSGNQVQQLIIEARRGLEKKQTLIKKNRLNERERSSRSESVTKEDGDEREEEELDESDTSESEDKGKDGEASESETSEDDEEQLTEKYGAELAELTSEITMKQRLIDELELSQKRLDLLKEQYESKMQQLQTKIRNVEIERDRVLAGYGGGPPNLQAEEKVKKVKEDYEKKLGDLQKELKRLQSAQREHAKLLRNQSEYERQLKTLRTDLAEIKKNKVKLMQRMREEASKHKEEEMRRNKEIMQLRKQTRQHENQIRTLQAEKQLKDTVLRRKQEEVSALRKMAKGGLSEKASGRVPLAAQVRAARRLPFSPKAAKQKWQKMEKEVMQLAVSKQAVSSMEREMERSLRQRDELRVALERTLAQRNRAVMEGRDESFVQELEDQLESLRANIDYIQDTISDCQQHIMQLEDGKEGLDALESAKVLQTISLEEARYLIQKLLSMTINQSILASQREYQFQEVQSNLKQVSENNAIHQQLLQHLLVNSDVEVYNLMAAGNTAFPVIDSTSYDAIPLGSLDSSRSASPSDLSSAAPSLNAVAQASTTFTTKPNKARRRTALPDELLYGFPQNLTGASAQEEEDDSGKLSDTDAVISFTPHARPPPYGGPTTNSAAAVAAKAIQRVPSAPGPLRSMGIAGASGGLNRTLAAAAATPSSDLMTRSLTLKAEPPSPRLARKAANLSATNLAAARLLSSDPEITTPPSSPPTYRRSTSREENPNVFSRLTSGTAVATQQQPGTGTINAFAGKMSNKTPLLCSFVAEGHSKAVLSICATDNRLFSGSKDRTVKVWDLVSGREIMALENHSNNVVAVRYSESTRLAFSVSSAFIKIWDLRLNPVRCVKTLCSSGSTSVTQPVGLISRSVQLPAGETLVNDIALSQVHPHLLYSAAGNQVRAFDLRRYAVVAKLSGGHQAAVMCLAVASQLATDKGIIPNGELVITGSKDHYIKVFDVGEGASGLITPRFNLDPPHYDGVQCLAMHGSVLFSGSRDACIKKWDLEQAEMVQSLNNVHKDWICGMSVLPGGQYLVSGCRAGHLRLWSTDAGAALGEMKAHNYGINAIATNSTHVFTASSDNTVGLWRVRNNLDVSPDYE